MKLNLPRTGYNPLVPIANQGIAGSIGIVGAIGANIAKNGAGVAQKVGTGAGATAGGGVIKNSAGAEPKVAEPKVAEPKDAGIKGVDNAVADNMYKPFSQSDESKNADKLAQDSLDTLNALPTPSISQDTLDAMNTPFTKSSAYLEAMELTNGMLAKLSSGRTSYTDQIQSMMDKIMNREDFSYDVENDMLFQQALASAMGSGKQAMQDTMGQASALTGGYGSTYAQSVGNQAYNAYIEDAYNNLPEYYQMALQAYQMEGEEMYNQLNMLNVADAQEYQRMYDSWSANFTNAQNIYAQDYGAWQDSVNNAYNSANLQLKEQGMIHDQAYNNYIANQSKAETLYNQEFNMWAEEVNNAMTIAGVQNSDYWNSIDDDYRNRSLEADDDYRNRALDQDQSQFVSRYDMNGDGKVDANDYIAEEEEVNEEVTLAEPTETQKQKALKAYNEGGETAYMQYIDSLPSNVDVLAIEDYVVGNEESGAQGYGILPLEKRTYTKVEDTWNGMWGIDNNDIVKDQYGNKFRIDELPKGMRQKLTDLKEGKSYTAK